MHSLIMMANHGRAFSPAYIEAGKALEPLWRGLDWVTNPLAKQRRDLTHSGLHCSSIECTPTWRRTHAPARYTTNQADTTCTFSATLADWAKAHGMKPGEEEQVVVVKQAAWSRKWSWSNTADDVNESPHDGNAADEGFLFGLAGCCSSRDNARPRLWHF